MSTGAKQRLAEKLLRTMAAVPFGQSVAAIADADLVQDLMRLGFSVTEKAPGRPLADSSHDWGVVVLEKGSWRESVDLAVGISGKIRDGGWIFVGAMGDPGGLTRERAADELRDAIDNGLAVAEEVAVVEAETDVAVSAILRRVSPLTRP